MKRWPFLLVCLALLMSVQIASAQTGGQFCVRSFEDRDGDGVRGGTEPLLTRGVAVNLLNADGIVVASGLLENSPTAAFGTLCFQFLPAGQYTAVITSGDLTPTTPSDFSAAVSESGQPVLVEFGAQRAVMAPLQPAQPETAVDDQLIRVLISAGGALIAVIGMILLGFVIYVAALRPARPRSRPASGVLRPVAVNDDTGPTPKIS